MGNSSSADENGYTDEEGYHNYEQENTLLDAINVGELRTIKKIVTTCITLKRLDLIEKYVPRITAKNEEMRKTEIFWRVNVAKLNMHELMHRGMDIGDHYDAIYKEFSNEINGVE